MKELCLELINKNYWVAATIQGFVYFKWKSVTIWKVCSKINGVLITVINCTKLWLVCFCWPRTWVCQNKCWFSRHLTLTFIFPSMCPPIFYSTCVYWTQRKDSRYEDIKMNRCSPFIKGNDEYKCSSPHCAQYFYAYLWVKGVNWKSKAVMA